MREKGGWWVEKDIMREDGSGKKGNERSNKTLDARQRRAYDRASKETPANKRQQKKTPLPVVMSRQSEVRARRTAERLRTEFRWSSDRRSWYSASTLTSRTPTSISARRLTTTWLRIANVGSTRIVTAVRRSRPSMNTLDVRCGRAETPPSRPTRIGKSDKVASLSAVSPTDISEMSSVRRRLDEAR